MSQQKDAQGRWVNVDDGTGMATHIHDGQQWIQIQPYQFFQSAAQPVQQAASSAPLGVTTYDGAATGNDIAEPLYYEPSQEELQAEAAALAASRRFGDAPPIVKLIDGMQVWLLPPFRQGTWAQRMLRHFNFTEGNWPVECLAMHNLPCPLCKHAEALEEHRNDLHLDDKTLRQWKMNETYTYLVFVMDEQSGTIREFPVGQRQLVVSSSLHAIVSNLVGTTPGLLGPTTGRPIRLYKVPGKGGVSRWNANIFHSVFPISSGHPEALNYVQTNLFDLRKICKVPSIGDVEKILLEAIQAGRTPDVRQFVVPGSSVYQHGLRGVTPAAQAGFQPHFTAPQPQPAQQQQPPQSFPPPQQFPQQVQQQPPPVTYAPPTSVPQPAAYAVPPTSAVPPTAALPPTSAAPLPVVPAIDPLAAVAAPPSAAPEHSVGTKLTDQLASLPLPPAGNPPV